MVASAKQRAKVLVVIFHLWQSSTMINLAAQEACIHSVPKRNAEIRMQTESLFSSESRVQNKHLVNS
jgi:hypothetical protein